MLSGTVITLSAEAEPPTPAKCFRVNDDMQMPTCTYSGGKWTVSYDEGPSGGGGAPAGFSVLIVFALLAGIAFTVWKVSTARRMARASGMSEGDATAMALLTDNGFEATYLASNLRPPTPPLAPPATARPLIARLAELDDLLAAGAVSADEHAAARARILGQL